MLLSFCESSSSHVYYSPESGKTITSDILRGTWMLIDSYDKSGKRFQFPETNVWIDLNDDGKGDIKSVRKSIFYKFSKTNFTRITLLNDPVEFSSAYENSNKKSDPDDYVGLWTMSSIPYNYNETNSQLLINNAKYILSVPDKSLYVKIIINSDNTDKYIILMKKVDSVYGESNKPDWLNTTENNIILASSVLENNIEKTQCSDAGGINIDSPWSDADWINFINY